MNFLFTLSYAFFKSTIYILKLLSWQRTGDHGMTEKMYLRFPRVAYGLCTEILDDPWVSPILEGY